MFRKIFLNKTNTQKNPMRSKYINTFETTADFEDYIESNAASFPNVALTESDSTVHYTAVSPANHIIYGELYDTAGNAPIARFNTNTDVTTNVDNNKFYLDDYDISLISVTSLEQLFGTTSGTLLNPTPALNQDNIKSIKKLAIDTTNVTNIGYMFALCSNMTYCNLTNFITSDITSTERMFYRCDKLETLDLSGCDFSGVTNFNYMFAVVGYKLSSVYITEEATLMKLTNNLTSCGDSATNTTKYIPGSATIYYNDQQYKWQNNAWTLQTT